MLRRSYRRFIDYVADLKIILGEFSDTIVSKSVNVFEATPTEEFVRVS